MSVLQTILKWARANPKTAGVHVASGIVLLNPNFINTRIFYKIGFEATGPRADSIAADTMRGQKGVEPQSTYAIMQSAAMGGYGTDTAASATRIGAVMLSVVVYLWGRRAAKIATIKKLPDRR